MKFRAAVPAGVPFGSNDEAIRFAKAFLEEHFDLSGLEVKGEVLSHSATGGASPSGPEGQEPMVSFGFRAGGYAIGGAYVNVYLRGKAVASASACVPEIQVEGTDRKVVSRARATRSFQRLARKMGESPESLPALEITYVWSPVDNDVDRDEIRDGSVFRAQWGAPGMDIYVDAHTGKVWRND